MTDTFAFFTEFRGFHVYCNTVNWVPYVGQIIIFKREYNSKHDRFALAGKTLSKAALHQLLLNMFLENFPDTLGMRYKRWHNSKQQFIIKKPRPSPSVQGGLQIPVGSKLFSLW